jgi:hypothetical protein
LIQSPEHKTSDAEEYKKHSHGSHSADNNGIILLFISVERALSAQWLSWSKKCLDLKCIDIYTDVRCMVLKIMVVVVMMVIMHDMVIVVMMVMIMMVYWWFW